MDPPDSFAYLDPETRVITPEVKQKFENAEIEEQEMIKQRYVDFKIRAFEAITKAVELRNRHWGETHPLTLSCHLIHLSMLEVIEDYDELLEQLNIWLFRIENWLEEADSAIANLPPIPGIEENDLKKLYEEDRQMLIGFYACIIRLLTDTLVMKKETDDAIELAMVAMKILSENASSNIVPIVLIGRNLANGYLEKGKLKEAGDVIESLLDLQSEYSFPQNSKASFTVNEWIDPIRERINTTLHLAKIKLGLEQYDESEALLRVALNLGIEHAGKFTPLACQIQMDILALVKQHPKKTDQDFIDLLFLTLDIAKETQKRLKQDLDNTDKLMDKKAIAQAMPYTNLCRLSLEFFKYSKEHEKLYTKLILETIKAWNEQQTDGFDKEFCAFSLSATEQLLLKGYFNEAKDVLQLSNNILTQTCIEPSPILSYYMELQARTQLFIDCDDKAKNLPFIDKSSLSISPPKFSLDTSYELMNNAIDHLKRSNNNEFEPILGSKLLYTLSSIQILHGEIEEGFKNLSRCFKLMEIEETKDGFTCFPEKIPKELLETFGNSLILSAGLFSHFNQLEKSKKYYEYACKILTFDRTTVGEGDHMEQIVDTKKRYYQIEKCLLNLIDIQRSIIADNPSKENQTVLANYQKHIRNIHQQVKNTEVNESTLIDVYKGSLFKSGPNISKYIEMALQEHKDVEIDDENQFDKE